MRVLLIHKFFHLTGGAEVFLFETARAIERAGHEVAFMSTVDPRNERTQWSRFFADAPDFRAPSRLRRAASIAPIVYSRSAYDNTRHLLAEFRPDVVHAFNIYTHLSPSVLKACSDSSIPVLMSCNDYKHICPNYKLFHHGKICEECAGGRFHRAVLNRCCQDSLSFSAAGAIEATAHHLSGVVRNSVRMFLFSSDFMARKTTEFWGEDCVNWMKLRNPFDSPSVAESTRAGDYALFVGRFVEEKGAELLVRAAAAVGHVPVVIVGAGPQESTIRALVESLGATNVQLVGAKWGADLDEYLDSARFVVVPSTWHENYPYVVLQAFSRGKAVLGSNRGGIPELVRSGENGQLFDPDRSDLLAEALSSLWGDRDAARAMGHQAKIFADSQFNLEAFTSELLACYREVL